MRPRKSLAAGGKMDELPEEILQHIMSFLNYTDMIRASVVSKAWKKAISTQQCLNVTDDFIPPLVNHDSGNDSDPSSMETQNLRIQKVISMLISAGDFISHHNLPLQKISFKFHGAFLAEEVLLIDSLDDALSENIREFSFQVGVVRNYSLPRSVYTARSLHRLVLGGLNLSLIESKIDLPFLKELYLRHSLIGDTSLKYLITNTPQLETLKINNCFGFHALKVLGSHHQLKRIDLIKEVIGLSAPEEVQQIVIKEAPYVEFFRYSSNGKDRLHSLDVAACKNLKVLELTSCCGSDKLIKSVEQLLSNHNVLESFTLHKFRWISGTFGLKKSLRISSNSLRELWLGFMFPNEEDVQVDAQHLSEFVYCGSISSTLSFGTSSLKDVKYVKTETGKMRYRKLVEFLRNFNHFEGLRLDNFAPRHFKALKYLKDNPDPPLFGIKRLTIGAHYSGDNGYILPVKMEMLEGLFWMAPQLDTLSFGDVKSTLTFQFVHENSGNVEEGVSRSRNNILIIRVKVESCPCDAEGWELKKYFFDEKSMAGAVEPLKVVEIMSKKGRGER